jgi:hypothetical protein
VQETKPKDLPFYSSSRKVSGKEVCSLKQQNTCFHTLSKLRIKEERRADVLLEVCQEIV